MTRSFRFLILISVILIVGPALAGSIGYQQIGSYMDWEPDCQKPSQPDFYVSDVDDFNRAVDEFNYYLSEVEDYVQCIQSEAKSDLDMLARAIANGTEEKRSEISNEVEDARSDLEMQRPY